MSEIWIYINNMLGLRVEPKDLTFYQVSLRGILIFICAIAIVRVADKRFLSGKTAFDAVLGFILASMLARAINGSAPLFPTIGSGFVLVLCHRLLADLSCRWHPLGNLVKGHDDVVIENGEVNTVALRRHSFSHRDLMEDLRLQGVQDPAEVSSARLERNGDLSVIRKR
jgi:uncharacterized membrane protein YcaP (DUF421 family)